MYAPPGPVVCPACGSGEVEILAVFGTGPSDSTARCARCRTSFAYLRAGEPPMGCGPTTEVDGDSDEHQ